MSEREPKINTQEARYGVRLDCVIFPIDIRELRRALAKNGYELTQVERLPPPPTRFSFTGELARKAESTVILDSDSGEIGVIDNDLTEAKDGFEELTKVVKSELGVSLHEKTGYYWFTAHYKINTGKAPRNEIPKTENKDYIARCSRILGEDLSSFSLRIAPKNAIPNQEAFFDIAIEPDILLEDWYHVGVVFRNPNKGKTETFVRNLENSILKLIEVIEAQ